MKDEKFVDYYKVLQVDPGAGREVIEAAYKRLARKYHPDASTTPEGEEMMKLLNEAYRVLSDPVERARYDEIWRSRYGSEGATPPRKGGIRRRLGRYAFLLLGAAVLIGLARLNPRLAVLAGIAFLLTYLLRSIRAKC